MADRLQPAVGALGAVAVAQGRYNDFCSQFYAMKRDVLGASELMHSEVKGQTCFARAAFKRQDLHGDSHWLQVADRLIAILAACQAKVFVIWTTNPELLLLRNPRPAQVSKPHKQLLFDLRALMENEAPGRLAALNFDLRGTREDEATAAAIQNYLVRTRDGWKNHFLCIPNFTVSSVSPGLQAADFAAFLGARMGRNDRPELAPYIARIRGLAYEFFPTNRSTLRKSVRRLK
jgi:hypothetical protein